jgi:mRNA interferase MazF
MTKRGDVVIVDFPFTSGAQSKVRPALVVQNDKDNARLPKTIVAMITGNLRRRAEPTHLFVDPGKAEGASSGLSGPSLIVCSNLFTLDQASIIRTAGQLTPTLLQRVNDCLKAALEIP